MFNAHIFMNVTQKKKKINYEKKIKSNQMENYVVINGERHDLVAIEGCGCRECSLSEKCVGKTWICTLFDQNPVTGYDGFHFIKHKS